MKKALDPTIEKLWKDYKKSNNQEVRDKLIIHYAPLVKYVAGRLSISLPKNVDTEDLISYGIFGLIDAIEKFDLKRQIKFETYAISRIKGAIIDELRSLDWVPRSVRHHAKELEKVYIELENRLKRVPTDEELAEALGLSIKELHSLLNQLSYTSLVALEELWTGGSDTDERMALIHTIKDKDDKSPAVMYEFEEMKQIIAGAIEKLPKREQIVVALYYYEGLTLKEIGEVLGVTESRVSQLHTKAIIRLKARLKDSRAMIG